jgi:type VI secretion system secreted protein Hcp
MRLIPLCVGVLLSTAAVQAAPSDVFLLKIPGITGESTRVNYAGWIPLNSFSMGISSTANIGSSGGGAGAGKTVCHALTVVKPLDTTSPELALDAASDKHLSTVILAALSGGGEPREFLRFTLKNAFITAVQFGGDSVTSSRTETLTIEAEQIQVTAMPQQIDGTGGQPVTTTINCQSNVVS